MPATVTIVVKSVAQNDALETTRKQLRGLEDDAKKGGTGFNAMQEMATGAFRYIGAQLVNLGGQLIGFAKQSLDVAGQFESGMNQFAAAAGGSLAEAGMDLDQFSNLFLQLGKELPVSTMEVQEAAVALVKGGIDPATIAAGALRDSLNFAAAAGMGLEAAAELTVKQLGTFGPVTGTAAEQTAFMAEAQNLLVQAAGASTLNVDTLGQAMLAAGGQAKAAGLDYQDFVTTMGLISPAFGSAAEAGTSFKNMIVRLQPSTDPATVAMQDLGLMSISTTKIMRFLGEQGIKPLGDDLDTLGNQFTEWAVAQGKTIKETEKMWKGFSQSAFFDDVTGEFIGMKESAGLLQDAFKDLSDAERVKAMQTIFSGDAMGAANALVAAGAEGYEAFAQKMALANGVTAQAEVVNQGYEFAMNNLQGTIEALQISIGTAFLPIVGKVTEVMSLGAAIVLDFVMALQGNEDSLKNLAPPLQNVVTVLQQLTVYANAAAAVFQGGAGIGSAITTFGTLVTNLNPTIGTFIANIGSFLTAIQTGDLSVLGTWEGAFTSLQTIVQTVMDFLSTFIPSVLTTITSVWQTDGDALLSSNTGIWQSIGSIVTTVMETIEGFIATVLPAILAFWDEHGASIVKTVMGMWETLNTIISTALEVIGTIVEGVLFFVQALWEVHGDTIMGIVGNVFTALQAIINGALQIIQNLLNAALALFKGDFEGAWNHIKNATAAFAATLLVVIEQGFTAMWNAAKAILDTVMAGVQTVWDTINAATDGALGEFVTMVTGWFQGLWEGIKGILAPLTDLASALGGDIVTGIIDGLKKAGSSLIDSIVSVATDALDAAKKALGISSPSKAFADDVGRPMIDGVRIGWESGVGRMTNTLQRSLTTTLDTLKRDVHRFDMPPLPTPMIEWEDTISPPPMEPMTLPLVPDVLTPPPMEPMTVPITPTLPADAGEVVTRKVTVAVGMERYADQIFKGDVRSVLPDTLPMAITPPPMEPMRVPPVENVPMPAPLPPPPPKGIGVLDTLITKLSAGMTDLLTPITQATNAMTVAITDARHTTNTTLNQQRAFTYAPTFNGSDAANGLDMGMIRSLARTT